VRERFRLTANFPLRLALACLLASGCAKQPAKPPIRPSAEPTKPAPSAPTLERSRLDYPIGSLKYRILSIAEHEWYDFGQQTVVFHEDEESIPHVGYWEDENHTLIERINTYWRIVDHPELNGLDCQQPWSAAFVSWVLVTAGLSERQFRPGQAHWMYLSNLLYKAHDADAAFIPHAVAEYAPQPGDLICASRNHDFVVDIHALPASWQVDHARIHCDIVVATHGDTLEAIGGNVRNSVSKSFLTLSANGRLQPVRARPWFVVFENQLD